MIKRLISSPIERLIKSPISNLTTSVISRYITTFDSTANTFIDMNTGGETINDFEIEVLFAPQVVGINHHPVGGDNFGIRVRTDGFMLLLLPRNDIAQGPRFFGLGSETTPYKINKMTLTRIGDDFTATLNESAVDTGNFPDVDDDIDISFIGKWSGGLYFDGQILNFKLWTGGDRTTGTILRNPPINGIASETTQDALGNTITPVNLIPADSTRHTQTANGWMDAQGNELEYAY